MKKHIITIAGRPGSGKSSTAKAVADKLGFRHFSSGDLFRQLGKERGIDVLRTNLSAEKNAEVDFLVDARLREIGKDDDRVVVDSRLAWHWIPNSFKVFLDLDLLVAADRILRNMDVSRRSSEEIPHSTEDYAKVLQARLDSESRRYRALYDINPSDLGNYDLVIDTASSDLDKVVAQVVKGYYSWAK